MKLNEIVNQEGPQSSLCDAVLEKLTKAWHALSKSGMRMSEKNRIESMYNSFRYDLLDGDFAGFESLYDESMKRFPDSMGLFMDEVYSAAGLDERTSTYEDFIEACKK